MTRRPKKYEKRRYKDNRDWVKTNEQYVVRGTFYLDFGFSENWDTELAQMNEGKHGGQYKFPDSFIKWQAVWHQWVDYRGLEGISRSLEKLGVIPYSEDYSTAWYRIHGYVPSIKLPQYKELNIATDGTGCKRSGYMQFKYGTKRTRGKYVMVVITVDTKRKKLLKVDVHIEGEATRNPRSG